MTRRLLALPLLVALVAACADTTSPLAPNPVAKNTSTTYELTVTGNTTGPNGSLWIVTGSDSVCELHYWYMYSEGYPAGYTTMEKLCRPTALSTWDAETYNGGVIAVNGEYNGQIESLATVNGDMSEEAHLYTLPAGATVTLEAYPNQDCQFSRWRVAGATIYGTNPLVIQAGQAYSVQGWFHCGR
jgi:hypothetical protein